MIRKTQRRTKYARRKRHKHYMGFIAPLPCIVPSCQNRAEVAHVGDHAGFRRCSDLETLPICAQHHRLGKTSEHGWLGKTFFAHYHLDRDELITRHQELYAARYPQFIGELLTYGKHYYRDTRTAADTERGSDSPES